ncbi:10421_t:CDS:1, partial [Acaulospora morrowiae]
EVIFTSNKVKYDIGIFATMPEGVTIEDELNIFNDVFSTSEDGTTTTFSPSITYEFLRSRDVFNMPDLRKLATKDIHLVVLTHGIHGSTLDKLFLKEAIEEKHKDNEVNQIVFFMSDVNHTCTEDGIEMCGKRLADNLLEYVGWPWTDNSPLISKISLIGHSLGGLINIFLIGYLNSVTDGKFFKDVQPINFIALASPLLGSSEHPWFVQA